MRGEKAIRYSAVILLLAALAAQTVPPILSKSGVCDEHGAHLPSGYIYWQTGVFSGGVNNPPLMQLLVAAPLALGELGYSPFSDDGLWAARLPVLALSLALALLVYAWAGAMLGAAAGTAALFLYCFEPNVIAHSGLATLDLGVTAFLFAAFFLLWKSYRAGGARYWVASCLAMTAALLSKFTALLVLPVFCALLLVSVCRSGPTFKRLARGALALAFMLGCTVALSNIVYHLPVGSGAGSSETGGGAVRAGGGAAPGQPPAEPEGESAIEMADSSVLPDLFVEGTLGKLRHSTGGHFAYLAGRRSMGGWWYYFPVALAVKTPVPLLALFAASIVLGGWTRRKVDALFVFLPLVVYLVAMAWTGVNIGVRHVLLFYPFAAVIASAAAARLIRGRGPRLVLLGAGALWYAWGSLQVHPHYLAYFNEAAGGPRGGPRYLIDSNVDWGQDDGMLSSFISTRGDTVLVNPGAYSPSVGTIAVNVNSLRGIFRGDDTAYRWLDPFEPSLTLGYTWYVYELDVEDFARAAAAEPDSVIGKIRLAGALKKSARLEEALEHAREAAAASARRGGNVMYTAGWWLLESGRYAEASDALAAAVDKGAGEEAIAAMEAARTEIAREKGAAGPGALAELADFYVARERTDRAREILQEALAIYPEAAAPRLAMASLMAREGDYAAALDAALAALEIDPALERARRLANWARAMESMRRDRGSYDSRMWLGRSDYQFGRPAGAAVHFWEAFRLRPSSQEALASLGEIVVRAKLGVLELETPWESRWAQASDR